MSQSGFRFVIQFMMKIKKCKNQRSKYKSVNSNERALIIQYIEQYKYSTSHVSMITGHNSSTIKAIYQVYKKEGRIQKKEKRDKILNLTVQTILVVADDINDSYINLGQEVQELNAITVDENNIGKFKEQMIKEQLINKKCKILSSLVNCQAENNFVQEMNTIFQSKDLINEFSNINHNPKQISLEQQQLIFQKNRKQEKCSKLTQIPQIQNKNLNSQILNILHEQHRLMKS